ncbi:MAG: hypothetical protein FWG87_06000 [Defluviitaleaceae bacterium]|nr:hypothetical protein [Defluviitaleaceae bacterium]
MTRIKSRIMCMFVVCLLSVSAIPLVLFADDVPVDGMRVSMSATVTDTQLTLVVKTEFGPNAGGGWGAGLSGLNATVTTDSPHLSIASDEIIASNVDMAYTAINDVPGGRRYEAPAASFDFGSAVGDVIRIVYNIAPTASGVAKFDVKFDNTECWAMGVDYPTVYVPFSHDFGGGGDDPILSMTLTGDGAFGTITSGTTVAPRQFTIQNTGNVDLTNFSHNNPTGFTVTGLPSNLEAGASANFQVVPTSNTASATANLTITAQYEGTNVTATPSIPLSITVTAAPTPSMSLAPVGTTTWTSSSGSAATTRAFTVTNTGNTVLTGLTAVLGNPGAFTASFSTTTLAEGATATLTITPTRASVGGPDLSTLQVTATGGTSTTQVNLSYEMTALAGGRSIAVNQVTGGIGRMVEVTLGNNSGVAVDPSRIVIFTQNPGSAIPPIGVIASVPAIANGTSQTLESVLSISGSVSTHIYWLQSVPTGVALSVTDFSGPNQLAYYPTPTP